MSDNQVYDFGIRLRQLREERGLSRKALAKKLEVSEETIYRYENNVQTPTLDRTKQIAVILRTSIDYLVGIDNQYTLKFPSLSKEQRNALNLFLRVFVDEQIQENKKTPMPGGTGVFSQSPLRLLLSILVLFLWH